MNIITSLLSHLNYGTIFFLMLLESTVIPVPSELVVSPAAYHAAGGSLNIWLVILFATLGADCGATINYVAGYYLGRPIIYKFANSKWGKMCLLNQEKVEKSERYFDKHGMVATITGRLIPGIRHLISIPAGLAKNELLAFSVIHNYRCRSMEYHPCCLRVVDAYIRTRGTARTKARRVRRIYQIYHSWYSRSCYHILYIEVSFQSKKQELKN